MSSTVNVHCRCCRTDRCTGDMLSHCLLEPRKNLDRGTYHGKSWSRRQKYSRTVEMIMANKIKDQKGQTERSGVQVNFALPLQVNPPDHIRLIAAQSMTTSDRTAGGKRDNCPYHPRTRPGGTLQRRFRCHVIPCISRTGIEQELCECVERREKGVSVNCLEGTKYRVRQALCSHVTRKAWRASHLVGSGTITLDTFLVACLAA